MGVPGKTVGTMFTPVPVEVICLEAERVGGKDLSVDLHISFICFFAAQERCLSSYPGRADGLKRFWSQLNNSKR